MKLPLPEVRDRVTGLLEPNTRLPPPQRQAAQLSHSLGQSRLAIARLYDQGSPEVPR